MAALEACLLRIHHRHGDHVAIGLRQSAPPLLGSHDYRRECHVPGQGEVGCLLVKLQPVLRSTIAVSHDHGSCRQRGLYFLPSHVLSGKRSKVFGIISLVVIGLQLLSLFELECMELPSAALILLSITTLTWCLLASTIS